MKKLLLSACTTLAIVTLLNPQATLAQKAKTAKTDTISAAPAVAAESPKAETINSKIKPAKPATTTIPTTPAKAAKPAATTISTPRLAPTKEIDLSPEKLDNLKTKEGVRVMTHEEIEKMMAEKALVMEAMLHKPAPAFTATDLNGKIYNLDELKGKTVVLNFWFIGCKPCVMEMPHLNNLVEKYKNGEVVFIAFALDSETALQKFLAKNTFSYNVIPDAGKLTQDTYKVSSYPTSIVIDKHGIVQDYLIGYSEDVEEKLMAFIDKSREAK